MSAHLRWFAWRLPEATGTHTAGQVACLLQDWPTNAQQQRYTVRQNKASIIPLLSFSAGISSLNSGLCVCTCICMHVCSNACILQLGMIWNCNRSRTPKKKLVPYLVGRAKRFDLSLTKVCGLTQEAVPHSLGGGSVTCMMQLCIPEKTVGGVRGARPADLYRVGGKLKRS